MKRPDDRAHGTSGAGRPVEPPARVLVLSDAEAHLVDAALRAHFHALQRQVGEVTRTKDRARAAELRAAIAALSSAGQQLAGLLR